MSSKDLLSPVALHRLCVAIDARAVVLLHRDGVPAVLVYLDRVVRPAVLYLLEQHEDPAQENPRSSCAGLREHWTLALTTEQSLRRHYAAKLDEQIAARDDG